MNAVLMPIKPKDCQLIVDGKKTILVQKTRPTIETPFKCYLYEVEGKRTRDRKSEKELEDLHPYLASYPKKYRTEGRGKVICEFVCDRIETYKSIKGKDNLRGNWQTHIITEEQLACACMTWDELLDYTNGKDLYGWHISDLKLYDKPKELEKFKQACNYKGLCFSCKRASFDSIGKLNCKSKLTRPPQSFCYVEEIEA